MIKRVKNHASLVVNEGGGGMSITPAHEESRVALREVIDALKCCQRWTEQDLAIYTDGPIHDAMEHRLKAISAGLIAAHKLLNNENNNQT